MYDHPRSCRALDEAAAVIAPELRLSVSINIEPGEAFYLHPSRRTMLWVLPVIGSMEFAALSCTSSM